MLDSNRKKDAPMRRNRRFQQAGQFLLQAGQFLLQTGQFLLQTGQFLLQAGRFGAGWPVCYDLVH